MYQEILQNIINYWKNIIDDDAIVITPQSNLMDELSLSSVEMLNSLLMLEDTYGVVIPEKSLRHMVTIEDVARVLTEIVQK